MKFVRSLLLVSVFYMCGCTAQEQTKQAEKSEVVKDYEKKPIDRSDRNKKIATAEDGAGKTWLGTTQDTVTGWWDWLLSFFS